MKYDVCVIDYTEQTTQVVLNAVPLEDAKDFESVWREPESLVVIVPCGYEIVNREEQARKLGEIVSLLLDLSFGQSEDDEESNRINTAFHEGVTNGLPVSRLNGHGEPALNAKEQCFEDLKMTDRDIQNRKAELKRLMQCS